MGSLTVQAKYMLECEKDFSPQETFEYLQTRENFRFISETLRELLNLRGITGDDEQLLRAFRRIMREKNISHNYAMTRGWFNDTVFPSKIAALKMCFMFELSSQSRPTALDFLWNTCQVNGFNFRRVDDIIFYYALERNKSFSYAEDLIERYNKETEGTIVQDGYETKATAEIRSAFEYMDIMPEDEFFETLCENKKNFIGYRKMAHTEFVRIYDGLISLIEKDIKESIKNDKFAQIPSYGKHPVSVFSEVIFERTLQSITSITGNAGEKRGVFADIADDFPSSERIDLIYAGTNSEDFKEYGFTRKVFILCFFAKYVIEWEEHIIDQKRKKPKNFYTDFYRLLNSLLFKSDYALLYPRNPYDWLILNCVRLLDSTNQDPDLDARGLFNEALGLLKDSKDRQPTQA